MLLLSHGATWFIAEIRPELHYLYSLGAHNLAMLLDNASKLPFLPSPEFIQFISIEVEGQLYSRYVTDVLLRPISPSRL
jgi:hypothetical protein